MKLCKIHAAFGGWQILIKASLFKSGGESEGMYGKRQKQHFIFSHLSAYTVL